MWHHKVTISQWNNRLINLSNETRKVFLKPHISLFAWRGHHKNHVYSPCHERPPALEDGQAKNHYLIQCWPPGLTRPTRKAPSSPQQLSSYPGYFWEPHWFSMGLPEICRVTFTGMLPSPVLVRCDHHPRVQHYPVSPYNMRLFPYL